MVVQSWGFTVHPILGDGNCCFSAIASSLLCQQDLLTLHSYTVEKYCTKVKTQSCIGMDVRRTPQIIKDFS